jgi:hypothetical protein
MRGLFLLLAVFSLASAAMAQNGTCTAFVANQPILRQEGMSEAVGDIIIQCKR